MKILATVKTLFTVSLMNSANPLQTSSLWPIFTEVGIAFADFACTELDISVADFDKLTQALKKLLKSVIPLPASNTQKSTDRMPASTLYHHCTEYREVGIHSAGFKIQNLANQMLASKRNSAHCTKWKSIFLLPASKFKSRQTKYWLQKYFSSHQKKFRSQQLLYRLQNSDVRPTQT